MGPVARSSSEMKPWQTSSDETVRVHAEPPVSVAGSESGSQEFSSVQFSPSVVPLVCPVCGVQVTVRLARPSYTSAG